MISTMLGAMLIAGGLTQNIAPAESIEIGAMVGTGSGVSLAGGGNQSFSARSPVFLNLEVPIRLDNLAWLEITPGVQLELEGRVGVALTPKFRAFLPMRRPRIYGLLGGTFFVHPYTLQGVQAGLGMVIDIQKHFGVYAEGSAAAFFAGTDLMEDSGLAKLDVGAGFRVNF